MMQYSKVFKYLQKVFYITNCLTSNVTAYIQIKIIILRNVELEVKRVVYGKTGDFELYNLKIGKTWNGNFSFERGMGMWNISRQFLFGICTLCSALCVLFSHIYLIHPNLASFLQNNCKLILWNFEL